MIRILILTAAALAALPAHAAETVREFSGTKSTTTVPFEVDGPWLLDWRLEGDYNNLIALDVTLVNARTGQHVGRVLHTKQKGNGLKLFTDPGLYQLRISTTLGRWFIKIQSIEEDEIDRYTPRKAPDNNPFR